MKSKTILSAVMLLMFVAVSFTSCKKEDLKANEIEDASGLDITIDWTTNDGTSASNIDIDFVVYKGTTPGLNNVILYSNGAGTTEFDKFLSTNTDGDYLVQIDYFDLNKAGSFKGTFKGSSTTKTWTSGTKSFVTSQEGEVVNWVKITKSGNKYTITTL